MTAISAHYVHACVAALLLATGGPLLLTGAVLLGTTSCGKSAYEQALAEALEAYEAPTNNRRRRHRQMHAASEGAAADGYNCSNGLGGQACALCSNDDGCAARGHNGSKCHRGLQPWAVGELERSVECDAGPIRFSFWCTPGQWSGGGGGIATGTCEIELFYGSGAFASCNMSACTFVASTQYASCAEVVCNAAGSDTYSRVIRRTTGAVSINCGNGAGRAHDPAQCDLTASSLGQVQAPCVLAQCLPTGAEPPELLLECGNRETSKRGVLCLSIGAGLIAAGVVSCLACRFAQPRAAAAPRRHGGWGGVPIGTEPLSFIETLAAVQPLGGAPRTLAFTDVSVRSRASPPDAPPLLHQVSGRLKTARLSALLGPSGSGKSLLITTLAGQPTQGLRLQGMVRLQEDSTVETGSKGGDRGLPLPGASSLLRKRVGLLAQEDALLPTLTPYEAVSFAAALQLEVQFATPDVARILPICPPSAGIRAQHAPVLVRRLACSSSLTWPTRRDVTTWSAPLSPSWASPLSLTGALARARRAAPGCAVASGGASRWRSRWSRVPRCCSLTSLLWAWTRSTPASLRRPSRASAHQGAPSFARCTNPPHKSLRCLTS